VRVIVGAVNFQGRIEQSTAYLRQWFVNTRNSFLLLQAKIFERFGPGGGLKTE